ncbi:hypothetical protein [Rheinheimera sp. F8]|uniref:hypothetical protein n=1 Tax=Rheinheimera sp. F8 TaxID=1763998 RepID=UPI000B206D4C|nr:hypothetical protein [Rheinheimera sp. F8]
MDTHLNLGSRLQEFSGMQFMDTNLNLGSRLQEFSGKFRQKPVEACTVARLAFG